MAHLVQNMFSVREVPWHGLGNIVQQAPTAAEAIKMAGLNWKILEQQVYNHDSFGNNYQSIAGYKAITREDNGKVLSIMTDNYHPLQNEKAFSFFDPFIENGLASFQTAGSLKNGKIVWILAELNKAPIEVGKGDEVTKFLLLSNSHDGSMAVRVGFTPIRVVCNNTLTMAIGNDASKLIRIRHTSKVNENLDQLREVVNAMDAKFEASAEQYKYLTTKAINKKDLDKYIEIIFKTNPNGSERDKSRDKKMKEMITNLFENGAGQHLRSAKGTYWGAYNAVTEYLTHEYGRENDSRLYSNWFSGAHKTNETALKVAVEA